jgi:hypothetical protein
VRDYLMLALVVTVVTYVVGVANRGWTSPWTLARRWAGHAPDGHENAWSDDDEDGEDQMSVQGPLRPPAKLQRPAGPRPLSELSGHGPDPEDPQERRRGETRRAWVRRQIEAKLLEPGEIDSVGAEMWGVSTRQIRRDRAAITGTASEE